MATFQEAKQAVIDRIEASAVDAFGGDLRALADALQIISGLPKD
jgi:hypothetical protein